MVDHEALFRLARSQNAGLPFDPRNWQPNAGTKMVKDIMNEIKRKFAWIDLLKPETKAAVGVLAVLDPGQLGKISRGIPILWEKLRGTLKVEGLLTADESSVMNPAAAQDVTLNALLGPNLLGGLKETMSGGIGSVDDMLRKAELALDESGTPSPVRDETLGWGQLVWDRLTGVEKPEALRRALKDWLRGDKTFDITHRDETFEAVTAKIGPGVDFVVTGHTHLDRAIEMDGRRCYFNCGTWIRLLRFTDAILDDAQAFQQIYKVLMDGSMGAIDRAESGPGRPFVMDRTSAVSIRVEGNVVVGELVHIQGEDPISRKVIKQFRR